MLRKQFIALLFASVLMANLGHNIIPHHHHIGNTHSCHDCCDQDADKFALYTGDSNSHCQAFNGIEYYPAPDKQDISKPLLTGVSICLSQIIELNQAISFQEIFRHSRGSPPGINYLLGTSTGLRAPPIAA
jgi:hypothetical protein